MPSKSKGRIGILTAGGDCPGLNAVIRGVSKAAMHHGIEVIGIKDGFRGLIERRTMPIDNAVVSGVLTQGGTFLGSSRDKPHKMKRGEKIVDRTEDAVRTYRKLGLDCLVCLGGNGTQKSAFRLQKHGLNVITLPKTIDNDVAETDVTFGFDSAMATPRRRSIACTRRRRVTSGSSSVRSWATMPAGCASAQALPAARTSSSFRKSRTISNRSRATC